MTPAGRPEIGGLYAAKPRPAVIVQDDLFDATSSMTVGPMTSTLLDAPLMRIRITGGKGPTSAPELAG